MSKRDDMEPMDHMSDPMKAALARQIERLQSGAYTQIDDRLELLTDDEIAMLIGALVVEADERGMPDPSDPDGLRALFASIVDGAIVGMELADK